MEDWNRAVEDFKKWREKYPESDYARTILYEALINAGRFGEAMEGENHLMSRFQ